jgi:uncharacterized membrane protein YjjP (DUF1212 family)
VTAQSEDSSPSVALVLRLGQALHTHGYPAPLLEEALVRVASRLGLEAQFFSTPTSLFCSFGALAAQRTYLLRVEPGEVDLGKLADLDGVLEGVANGELGAAEALDRLQAIGAAPAPYGRLLRTLSFGLASGGAALFLGGGLRELWIGSGIGLLTGLLALAASRFRRLGRLFEPLAAAQAAFLATLAAQLWPASIYTSTLAGIIVLLPGFTLTVALTELATRHLASGTARLAGAGAVFLTIGFGVAAGSRLAEAIVGASRAAPPVSAAAWAEGLALVLTPLAFTVLLRAAPRDAPWIAASGVLAVEGGKLGSSLLGAELGMFVGAMIVGIASGLYHRLTRRPGAVVLVPGILLLVPGSIGFRSLASLLDRDVVLGVETAFRMVFVAVSLVAGLLVAQALRLTPPRRAGRPPRPPAPE